MLVCDYPSGHVVSSAVSLGITVSCARFQPNGDLVAATCGDGDVVLFDRKTSAVFRKWKAHTVTAACLSFSPDGTKLLTGGNDPDAYVWDVASGIPQLALPGNPGILTASDWSPDGSTIVTGCNDGRTRVYEAATGSQIFSLTGHSSQVESVRFSSDSSKFVTTGGPRVKMWRVSDGVSFKSFIPPSSATDATFAPDMSRIAAATGAGLYVWRMSDYAVERVIDYFGVETFRKFDFTSDGQSVLGGMTDFHVREARLSDGTFTKTLGWPGAHTRGTVSKDLQFVAAVGSNSKAQVWRLSDGAHLATFNASPNSTVPLEFTVDGRFIIVSKPGFATAEVIRTSDWKWDRDLSPCRAVACRPQGDVIACDAGTSVEIRDTSDFSVKATYNFGDRLLGWMCYSADGSVLAVSYSDGSVAVWDCLTGTLEQSWMAEPGAYCEIDSNKHGTLVSTTTDTGSVKIWDVPSGQLVRSISTSTSGYSNALFGPDGNQVFVGTVDNPLKVWDARSGNMIKAYPHTRLTRMRRSFDSKYILAQRPDGTFSVSKFPKLPTPAKP